MFSSTDMHTHTKDDNVLDTIKYMYSVDYVQSQSDISSQEFVQIFIREIQQIQVKTPDINTQ